MSSIEKEKNKTYTVRYRVTDAVTGKKRQLKKRGFKTKAEAREFELSLPKNTSESLFYSFLIEYIDTKDWKEETRIDTLRVMEKYVPDVKTILYKDITKPYLQKLRKHISSLKLSPVRKNKIIDTLKSTCRYASEIYDLPNYTQKLERFKTPRHEMKIWNMDEYIRFEQAMQELRPEMVPFFHLLYFTGLRKGEARALTVDDLDLEKATITVSKAMRRAVDSLGDPKNAQSARTVKIDEFTLQMLSPLKHNEKWLFGDYKPLSNTTIARVFADGTRAAGLHKIRIHDLRHSHCSYLLGNGADIVSTSRRMGHSSISTTLNTYSHVLNNADEKMLKILAVPTLCPQTKEKPLK